jgi:hypothetical protein
MPSSTQTAPVSKKMLWTGRILSALPALFLLASTVLYLIPRTSVLGAILLTGYLGGAVATHVRVGAGLFSVLFPVFFGVLIWGGLVLRDDRLRALLPLRS